MSTGQLLRSSALPVAFTVPWFESISSVSSFVTPSTLLIFTSIVLTVISVSPVRRSCSPRKLSTVRFSGRCTSVISGSTGLANRSRSVSPSGFSCGCGLLTFGSTTSSCATSAALGRAISSPCKEVGLSVRLRLSQARPELKSITDTSVSSINYNTLCT
ncbi:hypothetical protein BN133_2627 [Cronobacter dublinensis 582]|nr:hypothetical protein BN133_2627 [Cronobacter dublinensis 582]